MAGAGPAAPAVVPISAPSQEALVPVPVLVAFRLPVLPAAVCTLSAAATFVLFAVATVRRVVPVGAVQVPPSPDQLAPH